MNNWALYALTSGIGWLMATAMAVTIDIWGMGTLNISPGIGYFQLPIAVFCGVMTGYSVKIFMEFLDE